MLGNAFNSKQVYEMPTEPFKDGDTPWSFLVTSTPSKSDFFFFLMKTNYQKDKSWIKVQIEKYCEIWVQDRKKAESFLLPSRCPSTRCN